MSALLLAALLACSADPTAGLKVPDGFVITQFAGPELANDIYCLHIDGGGRVLVAGKGYVRHLTDTDGDGKADRAVDAIPPPADGPMGLLWEGDTLYVVSDGGLKRFRGVDGKGPTKQKPDLLVKLVTGGEHAAHAVKRGPDGKLWVLCGNNAGVGEKTITAKDSPVKTPVAGVLLRLNDDGSEVEVIADGFRNPYDFDFDYRCVPYTFDSDNERCAGLPWYEPTRVYGISAGANYGWLNPQYAQTWKLPPYFSAHPLVAPGRGSPTGVAYYRHFTFPQPYRRQLFYADWTFGKIYYTHPDAALPTAKVFLEATGENGFAPTGLAVHPGTGELYVSVGGRGTRGAVYRIAAEKPAKGEVEPYRVSDLQKYEPIMPGLNPEDFTTAKFPYLKLRAIRSWELALGDLVDPKLAGTVWEGYSPRKPVRWNDVAAVAKVAREAFPAKQADLNYELVRFLAVVQDGEHDLIPKVTAHLGTLADPVERVHYLIALGRLGGNRTADDTARVANELVTLDAEYERKRILRDRHWPLRLAEAAAGLCEKDPRLLPAVLAHPQFGHADHLWLAKLPGADRKQVAKAFAAKAAGDAGYRWAAGHVEFVAELPEADRRPLLLKLYDRGLTDAVVTRLAKQPHAADRERFVAGLSSASAVATAACAKALATMQADGTSELVPLVRALRRFPDPKTDIAVRKAVIVLLQARTGQTLDDVAKWEAWLAVTHPELAKKLTAGGYDAAAWTKRLAAVNWDAGDAERGKAVFARAQCAACHDGGSAVGPALAGVGKRFGRDDLLTAILDPSRDIPARYRTTKVDTTDGKAYEGVVIYEATDGVILQTGADTTVRVAGKNIESMKPGTRSLMPAGLMDPLTAVEIADLLAYLKVLDGK